MKPKDFQALEGGDRVIVHGRTYQFASFHPHNETAAFRMVHRDGRLAKQFAWYSAADVLTGSKTVTPITPRSPGNGHS